MAKLSYNKFRSLHKGIPQGQVSELWNKYKAGEYTPDANQDGVHDMEQLGENTQQEEPVEETTKVNKKSAKKAKEEKEQLTPAQKFQMNLNSFAQCYRMLQSKKLTEAQRSELSSTLLKLAKLTRPSNYNCKPEDGWQLWVGPHPDALLVNERNQIAFCITRSWWMKNYQGSFMVQDMILDDPTRIASLRDNFRVKNRLVLRNPIPGIEIMLPLSKLDAIVTSSHSYEG